MEAPTPTGYVYLITHKPTGKGYVGQAPATKLKNGRPYRFGPAARWSKHLTAAYKRGTKIECALADHPLTDFIFEVLEEVALDALDRREAYWIEEKGTRAPRGFNVQRFSSRGRTEGVGGRAMGHAGALEHYADRLKSIDVRPMRIHGVKTYVELWLVLDDGKSVRMTIGQGSEQSYDEIAKRALARVKPYEEHGIAVHVRPDVLGDDPLAKYAKKIEQHRALGVTKASVSAMKASRGGTLVRVRLYPGPKTRHVEFGGPSVNVGDSLKTAKAFIARLELDEVELSAELQQLELDEKEEHVEEQQEPDPEPEPEDGEEEQDE
jgi:hypothetical protein